MTHLTVAQRYTISSMLKNGYSQSATIAKGKSVVSRELKRNADARSGKYRSDLAQRKTDRRHKQKPKKVRLTDQVKANVEALPKNSRS